MAEGTDNAAEAEAFMGKAEALMIAQGISEAVARGAAGAEHGPEQIVERTVSLHMPPRTRTWTVDADHTMHACFGACGEVLPASRFPTTKTKGEREVECRRCRDARYAAGEPRPRESAAYNRIHVEGFFAIAHALGLRGYRRGDALFYVVGFEGDADRAVTLLRSLHVQAVAALWRWWRVEGQRTLGGRYGAADVWAAERADARRAFVLSFYEGAAHRIRSERVEQIDATPGAGIAIRDRSAAVDDHMAGKSLRKGKALKVAMSEAGLRAGLTANVGTTAAPGARNAIGGQS